MTHVTTKYLMNRRDKYHDFYWFLVLFPWTNSPLRGSSYSLQTDRQNDCARCVGRMIFPPLLEFPLIRAGKRISSTRTDPDTCDVCRGGTRLKVCFKLITKFPLGLLQLFLVYACTITFHTSLPATLRQATPHTFDLQLAMLWGS